jgi:hypothetical protein
VWKIVAHYVEMESVMVRRTQTPVLETAQLCAAMASAPAKLKTLLTVLKTADPAVGIRYATAMKIMQIAQQIAVTPQRILQI